MGTEKPTAATPSGLSRHRFLASASDVAGGAGGGLATLGSAAMPSFAANGVTVPCPGLPIVGGEPGLPAHLRHRRSEYDRMQEAGPRGGRRSLPRLDGTALDGTPPWEVPAPRREADGIRLDQEDLRLLALLAEGMPVSSVARRVAMSDRTIRRRIRAICEQLGVKATVQAIVWAARRGLV
jgi:DNA-binding CsgD family transcriptional regulator